MFKRKNRVPWNIRFSDAYSFSVPLFTIKIKKNEFLYTRFSVIVSKKIDKRATSRNKIKRLVRSIFEEFYKNMVKGYDILFIAKENIFKKTKKEIKEAIEKMLTKEGFLK